LNSGGTGSVRLGSLIGLAASFFITGPEIKFSGAPGYVEVASSARANNRESTRDMQEFAKEQACDERRRQREAAQEARRMEREARNLGRSQREFEQRKGGVGTAWSERGQLSVRSGTSSTTDQALPSPIRRAGRRRLKVLMEIFPMLVRHRQSRNG
jgi:hypothetical protein